jgi:hypothetical protein
VKPSNGVVTLP